MNALVRLDERIVPVLARGLRRLLDVPSARSPGPGALKALDDRFGRRGALALVTNVPQLGVLLVAALLVAGIAGATVVEARHTSHHAHGAAVAASTVPAGCPVGQAGAGSAYVGAIDGEPVATYEAGRRQALAECLTSAPRTLLLALVSLRALVAPSAIQTLLGSVSVSAIYVLLPQSPTRPYVLAIPGAGATGLSAAVGVAFTAASGAFNAQASSELSEAAAIAATDPADVAGRARFLAAAHADSQSAAALTHGCGCIYGALVSARVSVLSALGMAVRLVDLAPAGANPVDVTGRPLLPSEIAVLGPAVPPVTIATGDL